MYKIKVRGIVQGVGFRPFVNKLAKSLNINGYILNDSSGVEIVVDKKIDIFLDKLKTNIPNLARIDDIKIEKIEDKTFNSFTILDSKNGEKNITISPDISICNDCLKELFDANSKKFLYPLINCTNCGPRYTIIKELPYDRCNTSMKKFQMCSSCEAEYKDINSRFYHAQPISCFNCGPVVMLGDCKNIEAIREAVRLLKDGKILAIKGIGGFHFVCNAYSEAVKLLRDRKKRSKKPFAVMFKNIDEIKKVCILEKKEEELICSKEKPIVVVKKKKAFENVAPNIDRLGVFLPYTPLYYLLFDFLNFPLVVTSANISDEPIIKDFEDIKKLSIQDNILSYNREIIRSCDDSVLTVVDDKTLFYRLSRGFAPVSFFYDKKLPTILAVGAREKNTISLSFGNNIILSPHIGDIKNIESFEYFKKVVFDFLKIYDLKLDFAVCDKHPKYETSQFAKSLGVKVIEVNHHLAHIYSVKAEIELLKKEFNKEYLSFSWDGTGYGEDKNIWGGEVFVNDDRKYHFKYFKIVGGEKAIKDIKLIAWSLKKAYGFDVEDKLFNIAYEKNINSFYTSSVGRLFDSVAYIAGVCNYQEYQGFSGLMIEKAYDSNIKSFYDFSIENGVIEIDFKNLISDKKNLITTKFLNTLSEIVLFLAKKENLPIIFSGGVFQNKTLLELIIKKLKKYNIKYYFPTKVAINDGGISLGQLWYGLKSII